VDKVFENVQRESGFIVFLMLSQEELLSPALDFASTSRKRRTFTCISLGEDSDKSQYASM